MSPETRDHKPTLEQIFDGHLSKPLVSREIYTVIKARQDFFRYPKQRISLPPTLIISEFQAGLFFPKNTPEIRSNRWNLRHKFIDRMDREYERVYSGVIIKLKPIPDGKIFFFDSPHALTPQDIENLNSLNVVGMCSDEWLMVQENQVVRKRSKRRWDI